MAKITLGGNPTETKGELPTKGTQLANITLVKTDMSETNLGDYKGKKMIFNIFPSVDTSVCAESVRKFNEKAAKLDNTVVLCVSRDLPFAQKRFCGAEGIDNVVVASDYRNHGFSDVMGTEINSGAFKGLNARAVVVADEQGKVIYSQLVPEIGNEPDYEAALAAVK